MRAGGKHAKGPFKDTPLHYVIQGNLALLQLKNQFYFSLLFFFLSEMLSLLSYSHTSG